MKLYRHAGGIVLEDSENGGRPALFALEGADWDELFNHDDLRGELRRRKLRARRLDAPPAAPWLAPVGDQEVWAAGVTYYRSRDARMEEAREAGGDDFYSRVYDAERPELFPKATGWRVVPPGGAVRIRGDSRWNVPEPELTLALNARGEQIGYTIGNDMSSRDIEGENPLYLPQAKVYDGSCALGPALWITDSPLAGETAIEIEIERNGDRAFRGMTQVHQIKRSFEELAEFLFRETSFPAGCYLMTGTGIVPPSDFSLRPGDRIRITVTPIGVLENVVA